ncbi:MAG: hypothetical protein JNK47_21900 [Mesorhizobium sp.]|nr:hypothetical protein [Mesorhizobium sp.]MBL8579867.1 hypothetical protein [Mesorhizobium sp.]
MVIVTYLRVRNVAAPIMILRMILIGRQLDLDIRVEIERNTVRDDNKHQHDRH